MTIEEARKILEEERTSVRPLQPAGQTQAIFNEQRAAFRREGCPNLAARLDDLERLSRAIRKSRNELCRAIADDFGHRSWQETQLAEIWPTLNAIRHAKSHLAKWMRPRKVGVPFKLWPGRARIIYQPLGLVGIISPWNYPFQLAIMPLVEALAAGNRVMLKPSELTPRTADFLASLLSGLFPRDKVATVLGGLDVAENFAGLPFDRLFFTGSPLVGRKVMRTAAENLTPVTLELGGKSPCIIGEDANLVRAARSIAFGKLLNAGQTCIAPDYVLVPQSRRDELIEHITAAVAKFYPQLETNPDYTSIINDREYRRLHYYVLEARANGADVRALGPTADETSAKARKLAPTLVIEPEECLALMREEIFGPVLPIKSYEKLEDAINYVNDRPRPLALYYFGKNRKTINEVLQKTISGGVSINDTMKHFLVEELPFGGIGASGFGAYHGEAGFRTFSHRKAVFAQHESGPADLLRPPFGRIKRGLARLLLL